jgi:UDP-N-acetyl-D-mannosaminuronic acid dehydrogenase
MNKVCVLGLGYIGLPTASILATHGFEVLGVDVSQYVVNTINDGNVHIEEPGLRTIVQAATISGNLKAALEPQPADAFIIAVPTPFAADRSADLKYVESAARSIVGVVKKGDLVVLESTTPPGTTEKVLAPILAESGLEVGVDIYVTHCPERVLPGKILKELIENDRVIGGINAASTEKAAELYRTFVEGEILLTDSATAEMAKLVENTYRDVNIALANELAVICEKLGINAWEVIELANRHPRVNLHSPGPGVGGHCISVDPWFIVAGFPDEARLIRMSREINDSMPQHVLRRVQEATANVENAKITMLGLAYKGNVDDTRESPAEHLYKLLDDAGYEVCVYDPHVKHSKIELSDLKRAFADSDCIVLVTDHDEFKFLDPAELGSLVRSRVVIDTRNCLNLDNWKNAGFVVYLHGEGKA